MRASLVSECALTFVVLIAVAQPTWAERLGFKGINLGAPLARVASDPRHECRALSTPIADTICSLRTKETETIAGSPVLSLHYFFAAGVLSGIQITLEEKHFQGVVDVLARKYGAGAFHSEVVQSLGGARQENRTWTWKRSEDSLLALRYSGRLDRSEIRFTDEGAVRRMQDRRGQKDPNKDI
jgi:hypothetical protein